MGLEVTNQRTRFFGTPTESFLEWDLFDRFHRLLVALHFTPLSIPSLITRRTIERQNVVRWEQCFRVNDHLALSGSAEQGILEAFADQTVSPGRYWAHNQCFRPEDGVVERVRLYEFRKTELFSFVDPRDAASEFDHLLAVPEAFMQGLGLTVRRTDQSGDPGYHQRKVDLEVLVPNFGWLETNSCTYFGDEQTRRFGISGGCHTISNTGLASPRILFAYTNR